MLDKYGRVKVRRVVTDFYSSMLTSRRLAPYFDDVDIHGLVNHQSAFLVAVMGGPSSHDVNGIRRAHTGLGITEDDFELMIALLETSLRKFDIAPEDIDAVTGRYLEYRKAVVASGSSNNGG